MANHRDLKMRCVLPANGSETLDQTESSQMEYCVCYYREDGPQMDRSEDETEGGEASGTESQLEGETDDQLTHMVDRLDKEGSEGSGNEDITVTVSIEPSVLPRGSIWGYFWECTGWKTVMM